MKLKDFKRLNENWDKWKLTEGKLQYSVSNTGYGDVYEFFDENGEETEQTLGMMVLDLADAGVGGWAPEEQIDRMMAVNADPNKNQGGMHKWDSSVFEDYYGADNQKILQAWGKMNNMELEQVGADDGQYEDDGTNDFEEYYSESKKRNKIHEGGMKQMEMQLVDEIVDLLIERGAVKGGINDYGEAAEYLKVGIIPTMESLADAPAGSVSPMEEGAGHDESILQAQNQGVAFVRGRDDAEAGREKDPNYSEESGRNPLEVQFYNAGYDMVGGDRASLEERIKQTVARRLKERKQR